jgi:predicted GNAT family N-acyltransferase
LKTTSVIEYREKDLTSQQIYEIVSLINNEWPNPQKSVEEIVEDILDQINRGNRVNDRRYVIWENEKCAAHARIFPRKIFSSVEELMVLGLADVCVSHSRRGEGLGRAVVEKAFEEVNKNHGCVSLFQTEVPKFYERHNCKIIKNNFFNSTDANDPNANPWWNEYVMIFPSNANFPLGDIDLNGNGY